MNSIDSGPIKYIIDLMKGIDAKKIKEQLSKKRRSPVTVYLNKEIYSAFKKACDPVSASRVIEKLMADFNESLKASKGK